MRYLMGNKASKIIERHQQGDYFKEASLLYQGPELAVANSGLPARQDHRYKSSFLLTKQGIPNVVWLEDVLALHGSNTIGWDLALLVKDPLEAATCLASFGYHQAAPEERFQYGQDITENSIRVIQSASKETAVTLLPAQHWYFDFQRQGQNSLPSLHTFLNSVMEFWLKLSSKDYSERLELALYIAGLISLCYDLTDEDDIKVRSIEYGGKLEVEHRELHYDIVAGKQSFNHTARHRYHAQKYREIKAGLFNPVPYQKDGYRPNLGTLEE